MSNQEKKDKVTSGIITLVVLVIAFILMAFCGLEYIYPPPAAKKVILIEMSMESGGGGGGGNLKAQPNRASASSAENLQTMDDISLPTIPTSIKKNINQSPDATTEIVEPKPNPNAAYRPGMGGGSGGGSGSGKGTGVGSGFGSGEGSGSGGGIGYGTGNRGYTYMPDLTVSENGKVYVEVHIDESGKVIDARIISNRQHPTTITNSKIQAECVRRAKTARYKPGKEELRIIVFSL